jgi:hypothetical protein
MAGTAKSAADPAAHSSRAALNLDPRPTIRIESLRGAPERRQSEQPLARQFDAAHRQVNSKV